MNSKQEKINYIPKIIENTLGISYKKFEQLDFDDQQKLVEMHRKKYSNKILGKKIDEVYVMVGSGENANFVKSGITPEEDLKKVDDYLDNIINKSGFTRKLKR